jgi:light-regulated signal transduction histidine kinase (bacteriophytochrome)
MVAGAAETFSPVLPAFIVFALAALVPLFIRFLVLGGAVYYAMAAMTLLYILLTLIIAVRINRTNRELVEFKERLQDRTAELSASNKALISRTERLERLQHEFQDFVFVASHDLQEPLRKIQLYCNMFEERYTAALDSQGQEHLHRVMRSASRMRRLLSDLVQFSQIASTPRSFKVINLERIAKQAANLFEGDIKATGGSIDIEAMSAIEGEETMVLLLFQNLISNAIKFRGKEPPRILISAKYDAHGICEIFVKDNGIGFDPQYSERIFRPFQQLHTRAADEETGLGLTICRRIVERLGGGIRVESRPGKGSTFIIRLPVRQNRGNQ